MKKFFLLPVLSLFLIVLTGCGEDLSFKEGSSQKALQGFLEKVEAGKKDLALKYVMKSVQEDKAIQAFIASKADGAEVLGQIYALKNSVGFKNKLKEAGKEGTKVEQIKAALTKVDKRLGRLAIEQSFLVKLGDKYKIIFVYTSQNLNNITGIINIPAVLMEKVNAVEGDAEFKDKFESQLFAAVIANI